MSHARRPARLSLLFTAVLSVACGDDGETGESEDGSTSAASTSSGTSSTTGTTGTTTTTDSSTTTGSTTDATTGSTTDGSTTDTDAGTSGSTGGDFDCTSIPAGPFEATEVFDTSPFDGSEDLAFDGMGNVVAYQDTVGVGGDVIAVDADGNITGTVATSVPPIYGIRYLSTGELIAASYGDGRLLELSTGTPQDYLTSLGTVNGVQPDFEGRIWVTNFAQVLLVDDTPSADAVIDPANNANGVVYDPDRGLVFFTNYASGDIRRATVDGSGNVGAAQEVTNLPGANPDGMALDVCGNLYVVDQGGNMIHRVFLDEAGEIVGDPEELLDTTTTSNIANAQFGVGDGWEEQTLYAIGTPGVLYAVQVGVPGAPYPTP